MDDVTAADAAARVVAAEVAERAAGTRAGIIHDSTGHRHRSGRAHLRARARALLGREGRRNRGAALLDRAGTEGVRIPARGDRVRAERHPARRLRQDGRHGRRGHGAHRGRGGRRPPARAEPPRLRSEAHLGSVAGHLGGRDHEHAVRSGACTPSWRHSTASSTSTRPASAPSQEAVASSGHGGARQRRAGESYRTHRRGAGRGTGTTSSAACCTGSRARSRSIWSSRRAPSRSACTRDGRGAPLSHRAPCRSGSRPGPGFIEPGTPAARADIEVGDRFVAVDGEPTLNWSAFVDQIEARPGAAHHAHHRARRSPADRAERHAQRGAGRPTRTERSGYVGQDRPDGSGAPGGVQ